MGTESRRKAKGGDRKKNSKMRAEKQIVKLGTKLKEENTSLARPGTSLHVRQLAGGRRNVFVRRFVHHPASEPARVVSLLLNTRGQCRSGQLPHFLMPPS